MSRKDIVSMVQVPLLSAQLLQKTAPHKNNCHHYSTENLKRNKKKLLAYMSIQLYDSKEISLGKRFKDIFIYLF